jgi:uncharacterized coiled-coil DUF342 family protein
VIDLEERVYAADDKLILAKQDLKKLSTIGMSTENLTAFAQRLMVIAQRHGIKPQIVSNRLFEELEQLDEGLGLDVTIKEKKKELQKIKAEIVRKKGQVSSLHLEVEDLRGEKTSLVNMINHERNQVISDLNSIKIAAELTISGLNNELNAGVTKSMDERNRLKDQAVEVGKELGGIQESIESHKWQRDLLAIVDNNDDIKPRQVREILIKITKGISQWLHRHQTDISISYGIQLYIDSLIAEVERWRI